VPTPANLGDVMKVSDMVIEKVTAKANTAIEKGQLVCSDDTGDFVVATGVLSAEHRVCVARENISATQENRDLMVLVKGLIVAKKTSGIAIVTGAKLKIVTAGTVGLYLTAESANLYVAYAHKPALGTDNKIWIRIQ